MFPNPVKKLIKRKQSRYNLEALAGKGKSMAEQYKYRRPEILGELSETALQMMASSADRVAVSPMSPASLPWATGYTEVVNAGKSKHNEDQAVCRRGKLEGQNTVLDYTFFGLYDGHGGHGTSLKLSHELHNVIHQSLTDLLPQILEAWETELNISIEKGVSDISKETDEDYLEAYSAPFVPSLEELISGALESSFWVMDTIILHDKGNFKISGGSTCLVSLYICDRVFVANAGDSRAVLFRENNKYKPEPLSFDFTPETDRQRIQEIACHKPELLKDPRSGEKVFSRVQFNRKISEEDVGKLVLYRDFYMKGWAAREVTEEDVSLVPLISGRGKGVRLMLTIGVSRSMGDFDLSHRASLVNMKDFLTPQPDIQIFRTNQNEIGDKDVLVMATDGMWDVLSNEKVAKEVEDGLAGHIPADIVFTQIAKRLVERARGEKKDGFWEMLDGELASGDDISVFVIPMGRK